MKLMLMSLLLLSLPLSAADDVQKQIQEVEVALSMLQQEQQNLFQQFQMLQELRRQELLQENSIIVQQNQPPVTGNATLNYDEVQKRERERLARIKDYTARLSEIHERYQEIDRERQVLIGELAALRQDKSPDREEMN
ncbi:hypothetical protein [Nitrosomonas mobilis]|uniref:YbgF trimerisation domain-containing protein n=1 Tax=Nitrosomonas mobilis TaxID=51642 RepID=A0A1G5SFJ2_9PROT|nr:hypothetical protein [Nitrosomonas mobilis]SCZ85966.1 conserved exported hypothetical protein [Nitrosomonas mobilis]